MTPRAARRRLLPGSPFNKQSAALPPAETFTTTDRVSHDQYGLGTVVGIEEHDAGVIVDFGSGTQRIALPNAKLTKL